MQITLNQKEIFQALTGYVAQRFKLTGGEKIEIGLTASRGPQGYTATVDIDFPDEPGTVNAMVARELDAAGDNGLNPPTTQGQAEPPSSEAAAAAEAGTKSADNIFG